MRTITLNLPEILEAQLDTLARENGMSRSEIVRRALTEYFSQDGIKSGSFLDQARDLAGSIEGPSDLSIHKAHLKRYGT